MWKTLWSSDACATGATSVVVLLAILACKGSSDSGSADAAVSTPSVTATAVASAPATATPSASESVKHPSVKQPVAKGCPEGWTRTTKGICVDWCETNDDCDDPKTCQDSPHVDPDLGKIKTCQAPATIAPAAGKSSDMIRLEQDDKGRPIGKCPAGWLMIPMSGKDDNWFECRQACTKDSDCSGKNTCCVMSHEDKACGIPGT